MSIEDYDDDEVPQRRQVWPVLVAAVLVLAVLATYGINAFLDVAPDVLRPAGDPRSYAFLQSDPATGTPVRYNPCEPLRYVVDRRLAPEGVLADLREGMELISEATGIEFSFGGYATEENAANRPAYQPGTYGKGRWAPVLFTWLPRDRLLVPDDEALGAAGSLPVRNAAGRWVFVTGVVTFNSEARLLNGFELGDSWGDVVLHEIGHLLGLAHVEDTTQVMHPDVTGGEARLGAGDLRGLELLGSKAGCIETPRPSR